MASRPGTIQIGPIPYLVRGDDAYSDAAGCWGRIDYARQEIVLDTRQAVEHLAVTLWHETMHGVAHMVGVEREAAESFITRTDALLVDTLKRNPALVAFLLGAP